MDYTKRLKQLSRERENGLVDILEQPPRAPFELFQQTNNGNNLYSKEAIQHNIAESPLNIAFFSQQNIDCLQNSIINTIYILSHKRYKIARQSDTELKIIMRSMYMQYGRNLNVNIKQQVDDLNKHVLDYCIPNIATSIEQYTGYIEKSSRAHIPMARSINMSSAGTKQLYSKF